MEKISKVKGYRNFLGFSQERMGQQLGISKQAYNLKENGKTPFSDREKIIFKNLLQEVFPEITIDEIFF
ncbi:XRE family transcriptional regulator [Proteiniclasticum sp.]|uniref:helix-turn-helix transcriptional regulator n=1 Tax=Proteiniclasticum sp. TaxID=2053595 RepID=UPI002896933A|nr:XRE family transcriptional regulator [Proteiniclasticum sp.]